MKNHETLLKTFGGGNRSLGFTLAEVLVTLGIIGVVSAMTLPTLVKNHQRQVYVTQLQKVVNELTQAFDSAIEDNHAVSVQESGVFGSEGYAEDFFRKYFKITQTCTGTDLGNCFAEQYKNLSGKNIRARDLIGSYMDCASIASGASICMQVRPGSDNGFIFVDINGKQGPNIVGRDFFHFFVDNNGVVSGASADYIDSTWSSISGWTDDYGVYLGKIMNDGWKMDY